MAKDELEWQQNNTKREIDVLMDDIRGLKQAISDKDKPLEVRASFIWTFGHHSIIIMKCSQPYFTEWFP